MFLIAKLLHYVVNASDADVDGLTVVFGPRAAAAEISSIIENVSVIVVGDVGILVCFSVLSFSSRSRRAMRISAWYETCISSLSCSARSFRLSCSSFFL